MLIIKVIEIITGIFKARLVRINLGPKDEYSNNNIGIFVFDQAPINIKILEKRYQLLHAIAEANQRNINDLGQFIRYLSNNSIDNIGNDKLLWPFNTMNNKYLSSKIDLYIVKTERVIT